MEFQYVKAFSEIAVTHCQLQ